MAAPAKYLAPQRISPGIFLRAYELGPLGLHLGKQFLADDGGVMVRNLDPLAFILRPYMVSTYLRHFPLAHDIGAGVAFIVQDMHH